MAGYYLDRPVVARVSDYPAMFWLSTFIKDVDSIVDFGGNLGQSYYTFAKYIELPARLRWAVCDVPAVVSQGEELAGTRSAPHLTFITQLASADVILTFGTLQYIPQAFSEILNALDPKPKHVIVNRTPVWDGDEYFTLEDLGRSVCPYQIFNRQRFVASLSAAGYELKDSWQCPDASCRIRLQPRRSIQSYSGFYFRLR
jgi:putative methyltransferase (TIGR04325 family)